MSFVYNVIYTCHFLVKSVAYNASYMRHFGA